MCGDVVNPVVVLDAPFNAANTPLHSDSLEFYSRGHAGFQGGGEEAKCLWFWLF
jgi:hypothetical protein